MSLPVLRKQIDQLDTQILRLLNRRARLAMRAGLLKKRQGRRMFDRQREQAVLQRVRRSNHGPLSTQAARAIYREILKQVRRLERFV